jgi:Flp pilus assembly protein protease CpaA
MSQLDLFFLIPLFAFGIICSYTDIKYGKIKNLWVGIGLIWVTLLYSYLALKASVFSPNVQNVRYLFEIIINGSLAIIIGFCIWSLKLWAAGDAKLFSLYVFLVPLSFYKNSYVPYFPALDLLVNTFCLIILFLTLEASFLGLRRLLSNKKLTIQKRINFAALAKTYLVFLTTLIGIKFVIDPLVRFSSHYLPYQDLILLTLLIFVFRGFLFGPLLKNKLATGVMIVFTGGYLILSLVSHETTALFQMLKTSLIYMTAVRIIMHFIDRHLEREALVKNEKEKEIRIYKSFAFAPFMLAGCIVTLLVKGSLITFLTNIFSHI